MPPAKTKFGVVLQKQFPFLEAVKDAPGSVKYQHCSSIFSIENGGKSDIVRHLETGKHKKGAAKVVGSRPISEVFNETPASLVLASKELTLAYFSGRHRVSGPTTSCLSKIVKECFEPKFSCGYTKASQLVKNVREKLYL